MAIAEQKAGGGKAYEASVSKDGKAVQYKISVAGADKETTVTVGPDGKVVSIKDSDSPGLAGAVARDQPR